MTVTATAGTPTTTTTTTGPTKSEAEALARSMLLRLNDFPTGWRSERPKEDDEGCGGIDKAHRPLRHPRKSHSDDFSQGEATQATLYFNSFCRRGLGTRRPELHRRINPERPLPRLSGRFLPRSGSDSLRRRECRTGLLPKARRPLVGLGDGRSPGVGGSIGDCVLRSCLYQDREGAQRRLVQRCLYSIR